MEGQLLNETEQSFENRQSLGIRKALIWGKEQIARQPLNELLLRSLHSMIIGKKADGFREKNSSNNFKNPSISPLHQFPDPGQIKFLVEDLIQFTKNEDPKLDPLVRTLIAHAQYEAIKPFEGSSGRSARLLLQLLLLQADLLTKPILCISNHLKKNFDAYSKLLQDAVWNGNWCPYLKFMLHGIAIQAKDTREKLHRFEDLYNEYQAEIKNKCPQIYTLDLVDSLFNLPVISPLRLSSKLKIHYTTATRYLKKLEDEGFLENKPSGKYQLYINKKVFQLLNQ